LNNNVLAKWRRQSASQRNYRGILPHRVVTCQRQAAAILAPAQAPQAEIKTLPAGSRKKHWPGCEGTGPTFSGLGGIGGSVAVVLHPDKTIKVNPMIPRTFIFAAPHLDGIR
jgi:hypothetical protein